MILAPASGIRLPRRAGPTAAAVGALGLCLAVNVHDPNGDLAWGRCPFLLATGLHCPGCGTLRAVRALTRGDLLLALDLNALAVLVLPLLAVAWGVWARAAVRGRREIWTLPPSAAYSLALAVPAFWVARNTPWLAVLAP